MGISASSTGSSPIYVTPVTSQGLVLYGGPGSQYGAIASVFIGDALEIVDEISAAITKIGTPNQWIKVRTQKGEVGWVASGSVQRAYVEQATNAATPTMLPSEPPTAPAPSAPTPAMPATPVVALAPSLYLYTTYPNGIYIRSGPDQRFPTVGDAAPTDHLMSLTPVAEAKSKLGKYGEWIQVQTPKGVTGWAAAWYLAILPEYFRWTPGHALPGIHGPADPWPDYWNETAFQIVQQSRLEAVKLIAGNELLSRGPDYVGSILNRLRSYGIQFFLARLFAKFEGQRSPEDFAAEVLRPAKGLYSLGVRYFEVHNEPNVHTHDSPEGMWVAWRNGQEFGDFFQRVCQILKNNLPDAFFGFPGVSPGSDIPKVRAGSAQFLAEADAAIQSADFVCMHTYWGIDKPTYLGSIAEIDAFCRKYPSKLVFVTEFSNNNPNIGKDVKGREYGMFYNETRRLPPNLGATFSYILSASNGYQGETWAASPIASLVGGRPTPTV